MSINDKKSFWEDRKKIGYFVDNGEVLDYLIVKHDNIYEVYWFDRMHMLCYLPETHEDRLKTTCSSEEELKNEIEIAFIRYFDKSPIARILLPFYAPPIMMKCYGNMMIKKIMDELIEKHKWYNRDNRPYLTDYDYLLYSNKEEKERYDSYEEDEDEWPDTIPDCFRKKPRNQGKKG